MLKITISSDEQYDEVNNEFIYPREQVLQLEHSLVSLSKWESKWCKPFMRKEGMTFDESVDYIRCMTITQNVDPEVYSRITQDIIDQVNKYIDAPMTATVFSKQDKKVNRDIITAELIYHMMITFNIPFECQKWHFNRLLTLINVCNIKSQSPKKMSQRELMSRNASLNATRLKQLNTKG
jgi:hypothetical protein